MYCTANDIINELTERIAAQLTNSIDPDIDVINTRILEADGYINTYLVGAYELPLRSSHEYIKGIAIDYVKYLMKKGRVSIGALDELIKSIDERLQNIVDGKYYLAGETVKNPYITVVKHPSIIPDKVWSGYGTI